MKSLFDQMLAFIQVFQVPLEKEGQLGGPILAPEELKTIFGSIPDILDVHIKIKVSLSSIQRKLLCFISACLCHPKKPVMLLSAEAC